MSAAAFLSHGPPPCVTATSHSINALFFAGDFGNDRGHGTEKHRSGANLTARGSFRMLQQSSLKIALAAIGMLVSATAGAQE
jgi:hypothetical protein